MPSIKVRGSSTRHSRGLRRWPQSSFVLEFSFSKDVSERPVHRFHCIRQGVFEMPVVIALVLIALGSVLFHAVSPWWWTPIASNWGYIDATLIITFWITGAVFVAVVLFMAYCVY